MTSDPSARLPDGELRRLPPRGGGWRQRILAPLGLLLIAGAFVAMLIYTGPPLLSDWQVRNAAVPSDAARLVKGSCSTRLVFAICDVTLRNRSGADAITRDVNYIFTDVHLGDYEARAVADPAHPELVTTDLGLDKLWNRTLTFLAGLVVLGGLILLTALGFLRKRRDARAAAG